MVDLKHVSVIYCNSWTVVSFDMQAFRKSNKSASKGDKCGITTPIQAAQTAAGIIRDTQGNQCSGLQAPLSDLVCANKSLVWTFVQGLD